MTIKDKLVKELSEKTGVDLRVVRLIVDYPLKFSRERMADPDDWRPVMIRYFGKFLPKYYKQLEIDESKGIQV